MNPKTIAQASGTIRRHYGLSRPVTPDEVEAEVANLIRRGYLDWVDSQARLAAALQCGAHPVDLSEAYKP